LVIPFAMCVAPFLLNRVALWCRFAAPGIGDPAPFRGVKNREIASVDAGAEKRTAIHNQPLFAACQWVLWGFHRFFAGFPGFCRL
jgi:hypothetical protein